MKASTLIGLAIVALLAVIAISTLSANGAFDPPVQCVGPTGPAFDCPVR